VPVGCDFQHPKTGLLGYLDGWNTRQYPTNGAWAVAAAFDDYAALVATHRDALPVIAGDLTPYYMGFYATRADLKRRAREAARPIFAAETFASALGADGLAAMATMAPGLELLTLSDHHDYLPGTSTDTVAATEQLPWLDQAQAAGDAAFASVAGEIAGRIPPTAGALARIVVFNPAGVPQGGVMDASIPAQTGAVMAQAGGAPVPFETVGYITAEGQPQAQQVRLQLPQLPPWSWQAVDLVAGNGALPAAPTVALTGGGVPATGDSVTRVVLQNGHVVAQFDRPADRSRPFALTSLAFDGVQALAGDSFVLTDYADGGGLWRLGNEMDGCSLTAIAPGPDDAKGEQASALGSSLSAGVLFQNGTTQREAWLDAGGTALRLALTTGAAQGTTRTATFSFAIPSGAPLRTSSPAGSLDRAPQRIYTPTFWPAVLWAGSGPWAVLLRQSTGVRLDAGGGMELLTARDARQEQCDVEGGTGSDPGTHRFEWEVIGAPAAIDAERAAAAFNRPLVPVVAGAPAAPADLPASLSLAGLDGDGVLSILKPATRGDGVILRALLLPGPVTVHLSPLLAGRHATRVDAVERDLEDLGTVSDTLVLDRARYGAIATVRLR
jgi:hypothetical protein